MQGWIRSLKIFAYGVILLVAVAIGYAAVITAQYWPAISV